MRGQYLWASDAVESRLRDTRVRNLLRLNAAFSAGTGLVGAAAPETVGRALGVDATWAIRGIGLGLVLYAVDLVIVAAMGRRRLVRFGRVASTADAGWVMASGIAVATGVFSSGGVLVLALLAVPVGALAFAQWRAVNMINLVQLDETPPIEALRIELISTADAAALWSAISDHALFGRLAANLRRVEIVHGEGDGMVRRCVARGGKDWTETCTLWDPGRRHAVEVDPAGYPYPLALVGCLSYVEPHAPGEHRVGAVFQLQPKPSLAGHAMVILMHLGRPIVRRIVRGWERAALTRTASVVTP